MAFFRSPNLLISFLSLALLFQLSAQSLTHAAFSSRTSKKPVNNTAYIVQTNNFTRPSRFSTQAQWYSSIIQSLSATNSTAAAAGATAGRRIFYTYDTLLHGFAAALTPQEAERASKVPGVIGVYEDAVMQLHTTRSPDFLGLSPSYGLWPESSFGEDVVIGLIDTGVWPESQSFNDSGLPPIGRPRWRGHCESGHRFNASKHCNKKLVGARIFFRGMEARGLFRLNWTDEFQSPRDKVGHGTHTASTAAGAEVPGANVFGFANGTARGAAPRARIAMYKACWLVGICAGSDILAAMEAAVDDGVDVLSLSLGSASSSPFHSDPIAIGSFAAVKSGVLVLCSAGNSGPRPSTVVNSEPWVVTVGAGSLDRKFPARITLGNGEVYTGESLYTKRASDHRMIPLVYMHNCNGLDLVPDKVMGRTVVCTSAMAEDGFSVAKAGGAGLISVNPPLDGEGIMVQGFTLPALTIGYNAGAKLLSYINSTSNPVANLEFACRTVVGESRAPTVAAFSGRGPASVLPEVLKPDVLAPGSNIIAAWPAETPPSFSSDDTRRTDFNILSGTSMSCPHAAGVAALLRGAHQTWTPAMVRSALMTTAVALGTDYRPIIVDEDLAPATPLAVGAGHVHPLTARDPGLVYDAGIQDYIDLLCAMNYTAQQLGRFMIRPADCSRPVGAPGDLNYPSFSVIFDRRSNLSVLLKRTLTKVSELPETYKARVVNPRPDKVKVTVKPSCLEFKAVNERRSYTVEFQSKVPDPKETGMEFGYVIWENDQHQVKSPVVFMWQ